MDGANIEICEETGQENHFIFGAKVKDINSLRVYNRETHYEKYFPASLKKVFKAVDEGMFGDRGELSSCLDAIRHNNDYYLVGYDFQSYIDAQAQVDECYKDQKEFTRRSIHVAMTMGKFNSDRTIAEYATEIWGIKPIEIKKHEK